MVILVGHQHSVGVPVAAIERLLTGDVGQELHGLCPRLIQSGAFCAVDLSDALEKAGYSVLGPAGTAAEALQRLAADTPTLAVIDMVLNDGRCTHLARELRQRGIPFLVHSSCRRDHRLTGDVEGAPWLNKPALPYDVVTLLDELFLSSSTAVDGA